MSSPDLVVSVTTAESSAVSLSSPSAAAAANPEATATNISLEVHRERKRSMHLVDGWVQVQLKTFTRWINYHLRSSNLSITDAVSGLSSGHVLNVLLEVLSHKSLPAKWNKQPKSQIQRLDNLRVAFDFLELYEKVQLVNVRPQDIETSNTKLVLGLVWTLIHKYQIMKHTATPVTPTATATATATAAPATPTAAAASTSTSSTPASPVHTKNNSSGERLNLPAALLQPPAATDAKHALLQWVNQQVAPYAALPPVAAHYPVRDFVRSWCDGAILHALTDSLNEDKYQTNQSSQENTQTPAAADGANNTDASMQATNSTAHDSSSTTSTSTSTSAAPASSMARSIQLSGVALDDVTSAQTVAHEVYGIPILMDAHDIVFSPSDLALMTYISCFRDVVMARKKQAVASPVATTTTMDSPPPAPVVVTTSEAVVSSEAPLSSPSSSLPPPHVHVRTESTSSLVPPGLPEWEVPLSPMKMEEMVVHEHDEEEKEGLIKEDEEIHEAHVVEKPAPAVEEDTTAKSLAAQLNEVTVEAPAPAVAAAAAADPPAPASTETISAPLVEDDPAPFIVVAPSSDKTQAQAQHFDDTPCSSLPGSRDGSLVRVDEDEDWDIPVGRSRRNSIENLIGAYVDVQNTPGNIFGASEEKATDHKEHEREENYEDEPAEDHEGKRAGETLEQSIDRKFQQMMNDIEICIVTLDHRYVQSSQQSVVKANELNTAAATWTIVDGVGGWKFLRDYNSLYLTSSPDGRIYTARKNQNARWKIIKGPIQLFQDSFGNYLTTHMDGSIRAEKQITDNTSSAALFTQPHHATDLSGTVPQAVSLNGHSAVSTASQHFKICFPVLEGVLKKKGTTGLRRWQDRYFAFNGSVMSYWRAKKHVGKERPAGIYHPQRIKSVNINKSVAKRFNIVFNDGKIVELLANTMDECLRWVRALNLRGVKTVQQTKRMSVFVGGPSGSKDLSVPDTRGRRASAAPAVPSITE